MATVFENVHLAPWSENGEFTADNESLKRIEICSKKYKAQLNILHGTDLVRTIDIDGDAEMAKVGPKGLVVTVDDASVLLRFPSSKEMRLFESNLKEAVAQKEVSVFSQRTDAASAEQYFQFYGYLSQQQNMMQDYVRTSTYQSAVLDNNIDFQGKIVLDVGAGSGILSFFAIQAGAKKVYAIEASSIAKQCEVLVKTNNLQDRIEVIAGKVEEVDIPEQVDLIISEPMGYMLFNERMLESFLHAKKWLKPGGKMFPTQGDLHIAPFTDNALYMEQYSKANFWYQPSFHGVDLTHLREAAVQEYFKQPIVDTFDIRICMARSHKYSVDFQTAHEEDLHDIKIPVSYHMSSSGTVHGLACWFDVAFFGSQATVWLSTSPTEPLTHWYQVRCLLEHPIFVKQGQSLMGHVHLKSNRRQSYDVDIELYVPGTNRRSSNTLDLKNPFFRYTGQQPAAPPGTNGTSPSEEYWDQQDVSAAAEQVQVNPFAVNTFLNGGMGDGQVMQVQQGGVVHNNLVPLAANVAPVNPGSIPAATIVTPNSMAHQAIQTRTSVGGGLSPNVVNQTFQANSGASIGYPISNQFMIGDYVVPGNVVLPTQGLSVGNFKAGNHV